MWIFLNDCMLSVVEHRDDRSKLMVRARLPGDLETLNLKARIVENAGTDYRFRCVVDRETFKRFLAEKIDGIDYPNFKDSIAHDDDVRHDWYMDVWAAGLRRQ